MNPTPKGKIGRLPKNIQEQVNRRLENGEKGRSLVLWLNSLPEVQAVLAAEFAGRPVREQNLSDWRQHGYKNWLWRQEALAMAKEIGDLPVSGAEPLADQIAGWVSVRYLMTVRQLIENKAQPCRARREECSRPSPREEGSPRESDLKVLRSFCRDVVALRRGDHSSARLKMQQERRAHRSPGARPSGRFNIQT
jgi:hypothetical protein